MLNVSIQCYRQLLNFGREIVYNRVYNFVRIAADNCSRERYAGNTVIVPGIVFNPAVYIPHQYFSIISRGFQGFFRRKGCDGTQKSSKT